jgi:hypothetical protein
MARLEEGAKRKENAVVFHSYGCEWPISLYEAAVSHRVRFMPVRMRRHASGAR